MKTYRHNTWLYFAIPGVILMELYLAFATWTFDGELKGGELMRYGLVIVALVLAILTTYLFLRFAIVRYYLTDEGILVRGLFSTKVRPWFEIASLKVNPHLKYFSVRDRDGKFVVFSSTDHFKDLPEFIEELQSRIQN